MRLNTKQKLTSLTLTLALTVGSGMLALGSLGCDDTPANDPSKLPPGTPVDETGKAVNAAAQSSFDEGTKDMVTHDKAGDWAPALCTQVAQKFIDADDKNKDGLNAALYNAGLVFQRCGMRAEAKKQFEEVLGRNAQFHQARVHLALINFAEGGEKDVEKPLAEMQQAISDSKFQNVEALVNMSMLQMKRDNNAPDKDGKSDYERAKKNLQRALAIDDSYMPAFNQLAIFYMSQAKKQAGVKDSAYGRSRAKKADSSALELAALVCAQAIRKNTRYAPIHNTAGLIAVQEDNLSSAAQSFDTARKLDPSFFEAQMNYAAVNLKFRGFQQSEGAYRAALKMKPTDYDAQLGLALALRGQIKNDQNFDKQLAATSVALEAAKKLDPNRPEAYFNDAILTQEYKAKSGGAAAEPVLLKAKELYTAFVQKAGSRPEFADAVKDVTVKPTKSDKECSKPGSSKLEACRMGRIMEIDQMVQFYRMAEADRKRIEQEERQRKAEEEAGLAADGGGDAPSPTP